MARETKIGLLAGLAFIICFAVILANRGRPVPTAAGLPYLVDSGSRTPQAVETLTSRQEPIRSTAAPSRPTRPQPREAALPAHRSGPVLDNDAVTRTTTTRAASNGAAVVLPPQGDPSPVATASVSAPQHGSLLDDPMPLNGGDHGPLSLAMATRRTNGPALTSPSKEQSERQRILQQHLDAASRRSSGTQKTDQDTERSSDSSESPPRKRTRSEPPQQSPRNSVTPAPARTPVQVRRHTVVSGDTLTKIAKTYYGSRSATVIKAIFEANRSVLTSPDVLAVGVELIVPAVEGRRPGAGLEASPVDRTASSTHHQKSPTGKDKNSPHFRWYQIKKNDRYISIAREQLGKASRWQEIYELNKDKFPDPQRIREGVRIKLPSAPVAVALGKQP